MNYSSVSETHNDPYAVLQPIMDAAYAKWPKDGRYSDFLFEISGIEKYVVLIGNLNYQVENGGFTQWADNGYGLYWQDVLRVLEKIGTDTAKQVAALVGKVGKQLLYNNRGELDFSSNRTGRFYSYNDSDSEDEWPDFSAEDDAFYVINEQLMIDMAAFVQSQNVAS
jgi:hypothetical protein